MPPVAMFARGSPPVVATAAQLEELRRMCCPEADAQLRAGGEWGLDDATLRRWLVARKGDVKAAARDLTAHAAWRAKTVPRGRIYEDEIQLDLEQNKVFFPGCDKQGRPLMVVLVSRHVMRDPESSRRSVIYGLDCGMLLGMRNPGWDGKLCSVINLQGLKVANFDFATSRHIFDLLQNHYPERLHKVWLLDAPTIFYKLWKILLPFIDPVTREKISFVYDKDAVADFSAAFDLDVLPPEIVPGGTGRWIRVDERMRMLLAEEGVQGPQRQLAAAAAEGAGETAGRASSIQLSAQLEWGSEAPAAAEGEERGRIAAQGCCARVG
ncbi:hypothetical protein GPECTOR_3g50 [Gonium pectorale]|uniref:CRAL-TRIO domain-containing protein n=1 Tax=Gonium pectorale TaxID=33097 RepID=A0A150H067_GONPE|nr:hypothetical protein GPECTOR_3g50 [Gonium pectorale]|eukprot:KXZ55372.1 hypothetical protein GPECTOR_3g50 [Gonium pectorale]